MPKSFFYPLLEDPYRKKDLNKAIEVIKTGKITIGKHTKILKRNFPVKLKLNFL